ncbi:MAG TPA: polyhydroxyalkanoate synthesis repressor PhaR [Steroidobacteraceae bacterium]|nr:polyhydroxyalkanoate synthesis repressor PhaR [Steroidobacteraceae bacterium]
MADEHVIKKYANRRLYDAKSSRHVTLDDLRRLIVQGEKVRVVDDKSGEDITRSVLLQIISDQEHFGRPILTIPVLEALIRFYGNAMQDFMTRYLEQSVENFVQQQQAAQAQLARMMSGTPLAPMADLTRQSLESWARIQESMLAAMSTPQAQPEPGADAPDKTDKSGEPRRKRR